MVHRAGRTGDPVPSSVREIAAAARVVTKTSVARLVRIAGTPLRRNFGACILADNI
jgi:hypothetical protein